MKEGRSITLEIPCRSVTAAAAIAMTLVAVPVSADSDILPPTIYTQTPTGVNLADGTFIFKTTDISVGPLSLERFHIGGAVNPRSEAFGPSWDHSLDISIFVTPSNPPLTTYFHTVHVAGRVVTYDGDAAGSSISPWISDSYGTLLTKSGTTYKFTDRDGTVYNFNYIGSWYRPTTIVHPNGRTLTYSYSGSQLKEVNDNSGYAIIFDYGSNGYIADACGFNTAQTSVTATSTCALAGAKQMVSYGYTAVTGDSFLTSVVDVTGQTTSFHYDGTNPGMPKINCVTPPSYTSCKIANQYSTSAAWFQIVKQTLATGEVWQYTYNGLYPGQRGHIDPNPGNVNITKVTNPLSKITQYEFVGSTPLQALDANGHETDYRYFGDEQNSGNPPDTTGSYLAEIKTAEGMDFAYGYDDRKNPSGLTISPKSGSGLASIVTSKVFPASGTGAPVGFCNSTTDPKICNRPTSVTDANGNQTDLKYDSAHGGVVSEMAPAPTLNAARPLKLYGYAQFYSQYKNGSGVLVPSSTPIWLRTSETQCQTLPGTSPTPTCDPAARQIVTNFEYGAGGTIGQLLMTAMIVDAGTGTLNLRTCYGYDNYGNRISETKPNAGLTSCP